MDFIFTQDGCYPVERMHESRRLRSPRTRLVGRRDALAALGALPVSLALGCRREPHALGERTRLVTLGSAVTEIVHALGAWQHVVGVDASSLFPAEAKRLPNVGYYRNFSVEGVIGLKPTLVLLTDESGPPAAIEHLRQAGVAMVSVPSARSVEQARRRILKVGGSLALDARAQELVAALDGELARARAVAESSKTKPRVLFIYARGRGAVSVAGRDTSADEMLRLAGAENAVTSFEGFRPLSTESVVAAAPEVLVVTSRGEEGVGGKAAVFELPGIGLTPAGRGRRVVVMDDLLLLGFGPRLGQAAEQLARELRAAMAERDPAPSAERTP